MSRTAAPIATLTPSPFRRWTAVATTASLGTLCLLLVVLRPPQETAWLVALLLVAVGALWLSRRLASATATHLELTETALRDGTGRVLAPLDRIAGIERGVFAFKPSNGFLLRLSEPAERAWEPGLWWRFGTRLGIGGVTPAAQGRLMADTISLILADRDAPGSGRSRRD